ncbi:ATP-binding protein, partial [Acidisphaera sp. L21]|uniref:ATP-binding protein n=1 Tax=Acidisphaera sp. L21 TaxID=1641851 RepID=UPI00131AB5A4
MTFTNDSEYSEPSRQQALSIEQQHLFSEEETHRTANILQFMLSSLDNKARKAPSREIRSILNDVCLQLRAFGWLHTRLHAPDLVAPVCCVEIISGVCKAIDILVMAPRGHRLHLKVAAELTSVSAEPTQIYTLALVVHELLMNSAKHGLDDHHSGSVNVDLYLLEGNFVCSVHDSGSGVAKQPAGAESKGMQQL